MTAISREEAVIAMLIEADRYDYPFNKELRPTNTTLIVVDVQFDF